MMTTTRTITVAGRRRRQSDHHTRLLPSLLGIARLCLARCRERRLLVDLTDSQLRDIGLTPDDVRREAERWPWDGAGR